MTETIHYKRTDQKLWWIYCVCSSEIPASLPDTKGKESSQQTSNISHINWENKRDICLLTWQLPGTISVTVIDRRDTQWCHHNTKSLWLSYMIIRKSTLLIKLTCAGRKWNDKLSYVRSVSCLYLSKNLWKATTPWILHKLCVIK